MRVDDFDFHLPDERIARFPAARRDDARLFVLHRDARRPGVLARREHREIRELPALLDAGDLLVFNDTKVIPARLRGTKTPTGGKVELLLVEPEGPDGVAQRWRALYGSSKPVRPHQSLVFGAGLTARLVEALGDGAGRFELAAPRGVRAAILEAGELPLPPYLQRAPDASDADRYQTIFARHEGAVAAPTAGLHFTPDLLAALSAQGIRTSRLTLHVGPGTFLPVRAERLEDHRMHEEAYVISEDTAAAVRAAKAAGRRVVAVGTTSLRALEAAGRRALAGGAANEVVAAGSGRTDLFVVPGHEFLVATALLTNFHLPRSTLLMLVAALVGREALLDAYAEAVRKEYRFYSYGDAMLIL